MHHVAAHKPQSVNMLSPPDKGALMPRVSPREGRVQYAHVTAVGRLLHVQLSVKTIEG